MTSKEIIIKLVDNHILSGEETYTLLNDILKGEMVAVNETLNTAHKNMYDWTNGTNIGTISTYSVSSK